MKLLLETTDWGSKTAKNNVYIFDGTDTKIVGYIKHGDVKATKFKVPLPFYKKGRTFVVVPAKNYDLSDL